RHRRPLGAPPAAAHVLWRAGGDDLRALRPAGAADPVAAHWHVAEDLNFEEASIFHLVPGGGALFIVLEDGSVHVLAADGLVDPADPNLAKRANRSRAQIGDVITYTIVFDNTMPVAGEPIVDQPSVWLADLLPAPLRYVPGSALIDPDGPAGPQPWRPAPDPADEDGTLWWELTDDDIGPIPHSTKRSLSYQAVVSAAAIE